MKIIYKSDFDLKHYDELLAGLNKYNDIHTKDEPHEDFSVFALDKRQMIGACIVERVWNWVFIEGIYYEDNTALRQILNAIYDRYRLEVEGIFIESCIPFQANELKELGFTVMNEIKEKPIGMTTWNLINSNMQLESSNNTYEILTLKGKHEKYHDQLENKLALIYDQHNIDTNEENIACMVFDDDKFIGGIYGYILKDYMHVNLLWVDDNYRGYGIASKLMDFLENESIKKGCRKLSVETCTFHCKALYEKRGYEVKGVLENMPKGSKDYFMYKSI